MIRVGATLVLALLASATPAPPAAAAAGASVPARSSLSAASASMDSLEQVLARHADAAAESLAAIVLTRAERAVPADSATMARALQAIGFSRWMRFAVRDSLARAALERSMRIETQRRQPDTLSLSVTEYVLAQVLLDTGQPVASIDHFRRSLALRTPRVPPTDSLVSHGWYSLGLSQ